MGESGPYYSVINAADPTGRDIEVRIRKKEKRRVKEKERTSKDKEIREEE